MIAPEMHVLGETATVRALSVVLHRDTNPHHKHRAVPRHAAPRHAAQRMNRRSARVVERKRFLSVVCLQGSSGSSLTTV